MSALELLALDEATPQIVAPQAGDTAVLPITLQAATGDEVALDLSVTVNKATSGNYTGFKLNVTETATPGADYLDSLVDLRIGGVSELRLEPASSAFSGRMLLGGNANRSLEFTNTGTERYATYSATGVSFIAGAIITWGTSTTNHAVGRDAGLKRAAAGVLSLTNASTGGGALELIESTAPAGLANAGRIYTEDNGAGKTRLMVIFGTGAAVQIAIEP